MTHSLSSRGPEFGEPRQFGEPSQSGEPRPGWPEKAALVEVFHSVQGEGRFVGEAMVFVRVAVCPIRCSYCDTPHSYIPANAARIGLGKDSRAEPNPVAAERALALVLEVDRASMFGSTPANEPLRVSVTGGEPLLYPGFVRALGTGLHARGGKLHLETAALDATALTFALPGVDHLSADWKLPETISGASYAEQHLGCVAAAALPGTSIDVKLVITPEVTIQSVEAAFADLKPWRDRILIVVQPASLAGTVVKAPTASALAEIVARARAHGFATRMIPQTHKLLGVE